MLVIIRSFGKEEKFVIMKKNNFDSINVKKNIL